MGHGFSRILINFFFFFSFIFGLIGCEHERQCDTFPEVNGARGVSEV